MLSLLLLPPYLLDRLNQNKGTTCLSNYCARGGASAWDFLLLVSSLGGTFLVVFEVRELPAFPSSTEECECNAITSISLLNALYSFALSLTVTLIWWWQLFLLTYFQSHVSPQVPPSLQPPIPLLPGADVALQAAFSPVSMTTRMTSAWGLKITVRTPNQLNSNKTFLIAVEIFLVTKKRKGVDRWGDVEGGEKILFPRWLPMQWQHCVFPRHHSSFICCQKSSFHIPEAVVCIVGAASTSYKCLAGHWCLVWSDLLLRRTEGSHGYCLGSHSARQGSALLSSGQTSALASLSWAEQGSGQDAHPVPANMTLQWAGREEAGVLQGCHLGHLAGGTVQTCRHHLT